MKLHAATSTDGYKISHGSMYPVGTTHVYSNLTPRSDRHYVKNATSAYDGRLVWVGAQGMVKEITENWEKFFSMDRNEAINKYAKRLDGYLGGFDSAVEKMSALHDLQYLPLLFKSLPEGCKVPMGVPVLTVTNTHPDFFWLVNYLETSISALTWKTATTATVAAEYKAICNHYAEITGTDDFTVSVQCHDFSMRGMSGIEDAARSGFGHLTQFIGTDSLVAMDYADDYYDSGDDLIAISVPACYDSETEVLTEKGFVKFLDLEEGCKVAQYEADGTIDFVVPSTRYDMSYKGEMVKWSKGKRNHVDMLVTPNHKMVRLSKARKTLELFDAGDTSHKTGNGYSERFYLPVSGCAKYQGDGLTVNEQLLIAFQADGSFPSRKDSYHSGQFRFSLKKERKIERLEELLVLSGLLYTKSEKDERGYVNFWVNPKNEFSVCKDFSWVNLTNKSKLWCSEFIEELKHWDGCAKNNCIVYGSINELAVSKVQAIASLSDKRAVYTTHQDKRTDYNRKLFHTLVISNTNVVDGAKTTRELVDYEGTVHCVSVPSKMLVVRRNGAIAICGNTEHAVATSNILFNESECSQTNRLDAEMDFLEELITERFPTGIISYVSDSYDFWSVITKVLPLLKDVIMARQPSAVAPAKLVCRPDSGNPVKVITGYKSNEYATRDGKFYDIETSEEISQFQIMGAVECLWNTFGGTETDRGFKLLDSHIGLIYGDSITPQRAEQILHRLMEKGFASGNVVLGVGSMSYQFHTRDTFGFAVKATHITVDGVGLDIFKDPKGEASKKSAKGLLYVCENDDGVLELTDCVSPEMEASPDNMLQPMWKDNKWLKRESLTSIRERVKKYM